MKKFKIKNKILSPIIHIVAFFTIFSLLLTAVSVFFLPKSNEELWGYGSGGILAEPKDSLDYLVIGNSNASEGFSPLDVYNEYGYTGYTCGEPWQNVCGSYYMLKRILKYQTPKVVFLETDVCYQGKTKLQSIENICETVIKNAYPVVRYHNNWKTLAKANLLNVPKYSWRFSTKGHSINATIKPCSPVYYMDKSDDVESIDPSLLVYLDLFVALCAENGIELVLISIPTPFSWTMRRHNAIAEYSYDREISFIDFNELADDIGIDWQKDTRDVTHLNCFGSQKFSKYFGDIINETHSLTDHRGDTAYAQWDKDYDSYIKTFKTK
ncbi:MAG: hypothetical protein RSB11_04535 [Oscillospiraceae bacterium]